MCFVSWKQLKLSDNDSKLLKIQILDFHAEKSLRTLPQNRTDTLECSSGAETFSNDWF